MPLPTLSAARVVDPVLSTIAQGYRNLEMIGGALFPTVSVPLRAGNVISFGKEDFMLYSTGRAPGENTKRVGFGYAGAAYGLLDYSLEGQLPIEHMQEAQNGPGIDMATLTLNKVGRIMALRLEKQQADLARTAGNYGSNTVTKSGTGQWSDFTGTSDPIADVEAGKEAIRAGTGVVANTMIIPAAVHSKLKQHPKVIDRIKYTGRDIPTVELYQNLFEVENVVIGRSIFASDQGAFSDVWGKDVILAYTTPASLAEQGAPTFGYTYNLDGYPLAEEPYYDRNSKSWYFPVTRAEAPVIAAAGAGYLIKNAVA